MGRGCGVDALYGHAADLARPPRKAQPVKGRTVSFGPEISVMKAGSRRAARGPLLFSFHDPGFAPRARMSYQVAFPMETDMRLNIRTRKLIGTIVAMTTRGAMAS